MYSARKKMSKIFNVLEKYKEKTGLIDNNNNRFSYNKILKKAETITGQVKKRSLILFISSNILESIVGYIAFVKNDNIIILLDKNFEKKFVKKMIKSYRPSFVYKPKDYFLKNLKSKRLYNGKEYELIRTNFKLKNDYNKKNFLLLTTSGSTQNPKLVRLSENNILNNLKNIKKYLNIDSNNTTITTMPMAYSYGLSIINTFIYSGAKIVLSEKNIFEKEFWEKIKNYKVNSISGVPEFFEFLKKLKIDKIKINKLKYFTHAGGKLNKDTIKYFVNHAKKNKHKFYSMYGQTEASPRMSYLECTKNLSKIGSIGKPLQGSKFFLVDEKNKIINKNFKIGEIVYKGKNVCLGYANNIKDLYKGDLNKGKLFTGDIGYKDNHGFFFLTGRKNRISKIFGLRFNLDDIENKLKKNNFYARLVPSNKYLKILIINNYNIDKIKNLIYNSYKINKSFIFINKVKKFPNKILFNK